MRGFSIALSVVLLLPASSFAADLRGRVQDEAGKPLAGVRVGVATAAPKVGQGIFCPSCYIDCRKSARSDDQGKFEIKSLDPKLKFRLLATAADKQTVATQLIDPAKDEPIITLKDFPADVPARRVLLGKVLSDQDIPIPGALVSPAGAKAVGRRWYGAVNGVEPAITDDRGEFRMLLTDEYLAIDAEVTAEGFAGTVALLLMPGEFQHSIQVPTGVTVRGQVVHRGQPQASLPVAVVQLNRGGTTIFVQAVPAVTAPDGTFEIKGLPADQPYAIFTPVDMEPEGPVVPTSLFSVKESGSVRNLGVIELVSPVSLGGLLRMRNDSKLPQEIVLSLGRTPAWDLISVKVEPDGRFRIDNLPPETYEVRLSGRDLKIDESLDRTFQRLSPNSFGIRLEKSLTNLEVVLRPLTEDESLILGGTEERLPREAKGGQTLAGKVVDPDGNPVGGVRIGVQQRGGRLNILPYTTTSTASGSFRLTNLPDVPVDLGYSNPKAPGYPITAKGNSILYRGFAQPALNQTDIRLLFDARLAELPRDLDGGD